MNAEKNNLDDAEGSPKKNSKSNQVGCVPVVLYGMTWCGCKPRR